MMAAITEVRSGAAAGIRTTKGWFFFFTLLILVCVTSSQTQVKENFKKNHQIMKERYEKMKDVVMPAIMGISNLFVEHMQLFNRMVALMSEFSDDFPLVQGRLMESKAVLKQNMDFVNKKMDEFIVELKQQGMTVNFTEWNEPQVYQKLKYEL
uniref:Uncharacterized protein n=1 Tax=Nothobranchius kadleci TaxID=1051664 RepID=A0A1A8DPP7_NOTKA